MKNKYGIIYVAINLISKKCYIGQTTGKLEIRISNHYKDSKSYTYAFANALKKYRKSDWEWNILYKNIPHNQLNNMEKWCIFNYNSYLKGYNSTIGGDHSPSQDPNIARKISVALTGRKQPKDVIEKRAKKLRGKKSPHSEETKMKISKALTGKKISEESLKKRIGKKLSVEHKKNISGALIGRVSPNKGNKYSKSTREKMSKNTYRVSTPDGKTIIVKNLNEYCKNNNLQSANMYRIANKLQKQDNYKGFKCEIIKKKELLED